MSLAVLVVSGIWPPAVGGPASHAPDLCAFLLERGHRVRALTSSADGTAEVPSGYPLTVLQQDRPLPLRLLQGAEAIGAAARHADVIYATGFYARSAAASAATGAPVVMKLTNDPAYERAQSLGLFPGTLAEFQQSSADRRLRALKALRAATLRRAERVITPSAYLAGVAETWGAARPLVVPNPRPVADSLDPRHLLRRRLGMGGGPVAVFAGRLVPAKDLELLLTAVSDAPRWSLVVIGDGPDRDRVGRRVGELGLAARVRLIGARPRDEVIEWLAAADACVLSSTYENHPHVLVEALAVGTPVIATAVGGVAEIVDHERTGLLVPPRDCAAFAEALNRCAAHPELLESFRRSAEARPGGVDRATAYAAIEGELEAAGRRKRRSSRRSSSPTSPTQ